ncbi:MAG: DUF418 domain-containing protein, partial [Bacteroidota bacterium]
AQGELPAPAVGRSSRRMSQPAAAVPDSKTHAPKPTATGERLVVLDALRGFALVGILLANLVSFFGLYSLSPDEVLALPSADRGVLFLIDGFIESKFFGLFSILFGIGYGLQAARMERTPGFFRPYWYRRMAVLLAIGLLHMVFVWNGDILTLYALLGMLLPLFGGLSDRALTRWIVALLIAPIALFLLTYATSEAAFWGALSQVSTGLKEELGYGGRTALEMRTSEAAAEVFFANVLSVIPRPMSYLLSGRYPQVLGLFLIGLVLSRRLPGIVARPLQPSPRWIAAFTVGLLCSLTYAWTKAATGTYYSLTPIGAVQAVVLHVGAPLLALGIGWAFVTVWHRASETAVARHLATLGRMALTNYLFQTTAAVALFFGYGLGRMGAWPYVLIPVVALGILLAQGLLSHVWLRTHAQGPIETVWKRLAYAGRR